MWLAVVDHLEGTCRPKRPNDSKDGDEANDRPKLKASGRDARRILKHLAEGAKHSDGDHGENHPRQGRS
jgi:hypothetical protein